tara:strand:+ start:1187 stop:1354 length:168 start_codon:yes stop_codon:yes gene_type:complete
MKYKLYKDIISNKIDLVLRTDDEGIKTFVPFDPLNDSYQDYLKWVEEGNTPDPAD